MPLQTSPSVSDFISHFLGPLCVLCEAEAKQLALLDVLCRSTSILKLCTFSIAGPFVTCKVAGSHYRNEFEIEAMTSV